MRLRLHEAGHAVVGYRFGYTQQGIMLREDDTGETSQQYATGMDDDMSVRLQTETIISMAGFAVTLEYPEYRTDALRIGGGVQSELVHAAIIHRIDPAMGSTDEIMDSLWVRARLAAGNNRPLIRAVADRLDRYGFYTGEEIQRILDESVRSWTNERSGMAGRPDRLPAAARMGRTARRLAWVASTHRSPSPVPLLKQRLAT